MIEPVFLGVGGAFRPDLFNTSACFQKDGTLYLLDCGGTVMGRLLKSGALESAERLTVLLTHLHADHAGGLGTLLAYCRHVRRMPVTVVHPEETVCGMLALCGIPRERYAFSGGEEYDDGVIRVRFIPVRHTAALHAFGMTLSDAEEMVYYSGDAADVPENVWMRFLSGRVARVYQDAALRSDPSAHGVYEAFYMRCPPEKRAAFFPIHWDENLQERILRDGFGLVRQI